MSGFFGAALRTDCVFDLFYGTDYHSHLGTRRAGLAVFDREKGFDRAIHNIETTNFRPKFDRDILQMKGTLGIGCISDFEPQPLIVRSHHGTYAITTVGKITNTQAITEKLFAEGHSHFLEMSGGDVNPTELVGALINRGDDIVSGIRLAQETIEGSVSLLLMTQEGIYAARDKRGRTPVVTGKKEDGCCVCFESFSFLNLGYVPDRELGPGEVVFLTPEGARTVSPPLANDDMRICSFLWIYYGFPGSSYEGINVEAARLNCGAMLARRDREQGSEKPDCVSGIPDSGVAHAVGYANESGVPYARPFVKYTPTWPRSFMPTIQSRRKLIAKMKLIAIRELIEGKRLLLIDDSIVRGTQLKETSQYLYERGAREVHVRPACPPLLFGCKYLNFSRTGSEMELAARRIIGRLEGTDAVADETLKRYTDPDTDDYKALLEAMRKEMDFTSLSFNRLDDMTKAIGLPACRLCTYCWNGKE